MRSQNFARRYLFLGHIVEVGVIDAAKDIVCSQRHNPRHLRSLPSRFSHPWLEGGDEEASSSGLSSLLRATGRLVIKKARKRRI